MPSRQSACHAVEQHWSHPHLDLVSAVTLTLVVLAVVVSSEAAQERRWVAFCLTGQAARLELASKARHVFAPNAEHYDVDVIAVLAEDDHPGFVFARSEFVEGPYGALSASELEARIAAETARWTSAPIRAQVTFYDQSAVVIPKDLEWEQHVDPHAGSSAQPVHQRIELYMKQFAGIRHCMEAVLARENEQGRQYDAVVRIRDDSFALDAWVLQEPHFEHFTALDCQDWLGVHDANYAVARRYAQDLFFGLYDMRFEPLRSKIPVQDRFPLNPEHWLQTVIYHLNIPVRFATICEQPLVSIRFVQGSSPGEIAVRAKDIFSDHVLAPHALGSMLRCDGVSNVKNRIHVLLDARPPKGKLLGMDYLLALASKNRGSKLADLGTHLSSRTLCPQFCMSCKPPWLHRLAEISNPIWSALFTRRDHLVCRVQFEFFNMIVCAEPNAARHEL